MQPSKQEHSLFSVMGQKLTGHATALIVATIEADAENYALHELGFVTVSATTLVSNSIYILDQQIQANVKSRTRPSKGEAVREIKR